MRARNTHLVGSIVVVMAIMASACTTYSLKNDTEKGVGQFAASSSYHMSQLGFGRNAKFGACLESTCPNRTPKTLDLDINRTPPIVAVDLPTPASPEVISVSTPQPQKKHGEQINLQFEFSKSALTPESKRRILKALPLVRKAEKIVINGRTDNVGAQKNNDDMAMARAFAVRNYIRGKILDVKNTIVIDARGACCFLSDNSTHDGRAKNRRVEIVLFFPVERREVSFNAN